MHNRRFPASRLALPLGVLAALAACDSLDYDMRGRMGGSVDTSAAALQAVQARTGPVDPLDYAFVVGESTLATGARRHLRRGGLPAGRICFSGFYKAHPHPQPVA